MLDHGEFIEDLLSVVTGAPLPAGNSAIADLTLVLWYINSFGGRGMRQSVRRALRGAILALTVSAGMGAGSASAAPHDLQSTVLTKRDVPSSFLQPVVKVYRTFPGTMAIRIASVRRSCQLPTYYNKLAWHEGVYEVIPSNRQKNYTLDITLCSSLFGTAQQAHIAYTADVRVVQALVQSASARKMHTVFIKAPRVGDESVAWQAGTCYWLRFRRLDAVSQLFGSCAFSSPASFFRWARIVSSRIP